MKFMITQVDAFTDQPFGGNPAAVCVLSASKSDSWMQAVAQEMNLSETAFLIEQVNGYNLRWFTPAVEVDLCGHATLASAHVLWSEGYLDREQPARFYTRSGLLTATLREDWIELDFPATPPLTTDPPGELLSALGVEAIALAASAQKDYLVQIAEAGVLRNLQPDLKRLKNVPARGVIVTSISDDPAYDFLSRFFAPAAGIDEDPVTGSAHCCLGPFWRDRLGKNPLIGYQASVRGGVVRVNCHNDRVLLAGQAVTVMRGELLA